MKHRNTSMKKKQTHNIEIRLVVAKGLGEGKDWESGFHRCKLSYIR